MSRLRMFFSIALVLAAAVRPVSAQHIPSPYRYVERSQSIGILGGWVRTDPGALDLGPMSGPLLGVRYTIRLSGPIDVEGELAYVPTTRAVVDTSTAVIDTASIHLVLLTGGMRFNLTGPRTYHGLRPFLAALGGVAVDVSPSPAEDARIPVQARFDFGTSFAGGFGAGVEWIPVGRLSVVADVRDLFWELSTPEPFLARGVPTPDKQWLQNWALSVGTSVRF